MPSPFHLRESNSLLSIKIPLERHFPGYVLSLSLKDHGSFHLRCNIFRHTLLGLLLCPSHLERDIILDIRSTDPPRSIALRQGCRIFLKPNFQ